MHYQWQTLYTYHDVILCTVPSHFWIEISVVKPLNFISLPMPIKIKDVMFSLQHVSVCFNVCDQDNSKML